MSVMIKNIDMPIGCQKCKFFRKHIFGNGLDYSYSCILGAKEFPMPWIRRFDNRAVDCPIIEVAMENDSIKTVTSAEEAEEYQITSEDNSKALNESLNEFVTMLFEQEREESEDGE